MNQTKFSISIAGHIIAINALCEETHSRCCGYLCESNGCPPELELSINEHDIAFERCASHTAHSIASLEWSALLRKISLSMLDYDTFLMHGAVVALNGDAYMFAAHSGIGKTTHVMKWLQHLPTAFIVNGDKPLIHLTDTGANVYGTPWKGKENYGTNAMVRLKAIVLMERGETNTINEISFSQALPFLLQHIYRPSDAAHMQKTLGLLMRLNGKTRLYRFIFNHLKPEKDDGQGQQDDAFTVAYQTLVSLTHRKC